MKNTGALKFVNTVYWLILSLWFGSLIMTGAFAAITFPTMQALGPTLPDFEAYEQISHWRIAAGHVMYKGFFISDSVQLVSVILVTLLTLVHILIFKFPYRRFANVIRLFGLVCLLISVGFHILVLGSRMNTNLVTYWEQAAAGEDPTQALDAFNEDHPKASRLMQFNAAVLALLVIPASACGMTTREDDDEGGGRARASGGLQEPELLSRLNSP